jgi:glycosyltransferase involved in cell wall biosynthesis
MLNIGFDAKRLFNNFTGLGNYSRSLVSSLQEFYPEHKLYLFSPKTKENSDTSAFFNPQYTIIEPQKGNKSLWRTKGVLKEEAFKKLDIFHGLSHELPIGIKKSKTKSIVTIHDLIYKTYPHDFSFIDRNIYHQKFTYACKNADKVIAVSQSTKNDLLKLYKLPENKVDVVYQSCHNMFKLSIDEHDRKVIISKYKLPDRFLLYVGSVIQRKNLLNIVKALQITKKDNTLPLVVIGKGGNYLQLVKDYIQKNKIKNVIFPENVAFQDLPALYQQAEVFIYPSLYEGFGIPIIEALWSKTPVITSPYSSLPEAAGDAAFFCQPEEPESIAEGILKIANNTEFTQLLIQKGQKHIAQFENKILTQELIKVYESVL